MRERTEKRMKGIESRKKQRKEGLHKETGKSESERWMGRENMNEKVFL